MSPRHGTSEGQALVEFALVLPLILLIMFGVFDVGRAVYTNSALSQAAREGARLAAVEAGCIGISPLPTGAFRDPSELTGHPGGRICPAALSDFTTHVSDAVNRMTVSLGPIAAVHISCNVGDGADPAPTGDWTQSAGGNGCDDGTGASLGASGDLVSVRVEHLYQPITPVISSIIGSITLSGSATMVTN
jgi:hypothetical protein